MGGVDVERLGESCTRRNGARRESILQHGSTRNRGLRNASGLAFFFSWFHNGGSPHGMTMPSAGPWKFLGKIAACVLVASVVLSAFGKGQWRLLIPAWAASLVFVAYAIFMID
jgi:hypothetical protein